MLNFQNIQGRHREQSIIYNFRAASSIFKKGHFLQSVTQKCLKWDFFWKIKHFFVKYYTGQHPTTGHWFLLDCSLESVPPFENSPPPQPEVSCPLPISMLYDSKCETASTAEKVLLMIFKYLLLTKQSLIQITLQTS